MILFLYNKGLRPTKHHTQTDYWMIKDMYNEIQELYRDSARLNAFNKAASTISVTSCIGSGVLLAGTGLSAVFGGALAMPLAIAGIGVSSLAVLSRFAYLSTKTEEQVAQKNGAAVGDGSAGLIDRGVAEVGADKDGAINGGKNVPRPPQL